MPDVDRYDFGGLLFLMTFEFHKLMRNFSTQSGLYYGQPRILTMIKDNEGCTLSALSELTGVGMPSLSVSVRNMKKKGLIKNESSRVRSKGIFLTGEGHKKAMAFHELIDHFLKSFIEHLGPERSRNLSYELDEMRKFIKNYSG